MDSLRNKIKELEDVTICEDLDYTSEIVSGIIEDLFSICDDLEDVITDTEDAVRDLNASYYIDLDNIQEGLKDVLNSLY